MAEDLTPQAHGVKCGRTNRQGEPCQQPAGFGTDHVGAGACKFHGGASPIRHGRYSKIKREELRELIAEYEADPAPLDLLPELATARALFDGYVSRYDELREALMAWNRAEVNERGALVRPQRIPPLESVLKVLSEISKIVKRIESIRAQNAISRVDLFRILREMGAAVRRHNDEPDPVKRLKAIEDDWGRIAF